MCGWTESESSVFFAQSGEDIAELLTGEGASGAGDEEPVIIRFSPFFTNPEPGAQGAALFGEDGLHGGEAVLESSDEEGTPGDIDIGELQAGGLRKRGGRDTMSS
ncbi:Uncharacterised protein [Salmonella enterica subsp. salamae]|nr:Uncharacterised protein [Salmonella enterica subsp. salamae]